jgi:hypothetical protein
VVKSSLALSLGLVGALSIVRFRTPIKEPEELVYLFMAIAIGLGYGAGHVLITTLLITITMGIIYVWLSNRQRGQVNEYNFVVNWSQPGIAFETIREVIGKYADTIKLVRLDQGGDKNMAVLQISPGENFNIDGISGDIRQLGDDMKITFYEADTNW